MSIIGSNNNKIIPYSGFPLIMETEEYGFIYGEITDYLDDAENGCTSGDAFIQGPDGSRAGLVWDVSDKIKLKKYSKPEKEIWGVYHINFPRPIKSNKDLIYNFRKVLPLIIKEYNKVKGIT